MSSLFVVGNVRQETFANAILAAELAAREADGRGLSQIFVIHSSASRDELSQNTEWRDHLRDHGVDDEIFRELKVDLDRGEEEGLRKLSDHIDGCLRSIDRTQDVYIDLTNGTSLYKNVLSTIGYVLGVRHQFILVSDRVREMEREGEGAAVLPGLLGRYWTPEELQVAYFELPDPSILDSLAPTWLTEVRRFNVRSREAAERLAQVFDEPAFEEGTFPNQMTRAVESWFDGERRNDGAALGNAVQATGVAFEDLISLAYSRVTGRSAGRLPLHAKIGRLHDRLNAQSAEVEPDLLFRVADLLRELRNESAHRATSAEFGRIRARLSTELLFATADYFELLHRHGYLEGIAQEPRKVGDTGRGGRVTFEGRPGKTYYFGLDGDDTGRELERLFHEEAADDDFEQFSGRVDGALKVVRRNLRKKPLEGEVLFCSGDDVLFKAKFHADAIEKLRKEYERRTGGLTCSVGYGPSPRSAYVALKMAKARPGKNSTAGVILDT